MRSDSAAMSWFAKDGASPWLAAGAAAFGIFLCRSWRAMTTHAWERQWELVQHAGELGDKSNPMRVYIADRDKHGVDRIRQAAERVIGLFTLAYIALLIWAGGRAIASL